MTVQNFAIGTMASDISRFLAIILEDRAIPVSGLGIAGMDGKTGLRDLLDDWDVAFPVLQSAVARLGAGDGSPVAALETLAPLPNPAQIFCCGANYARHVIQMLLATNIHPGLAGLDDAGRQVWAEDFVAQQAKESDPYIFMKTVSSITGPNATVTLPGFSECIDWEEELAVVFGRQCYLESRDSAMSGVAGYMLINDMTARDKVRRTDPGSIGADWVAGKGAPGFMPMGPWFVPAAFVEDPHNLSLRLWVNGELKQSSNTGEMTFDIPRQIEFLTRFARILPGDILCTGTPEGNAIANGAWLRDGDLIEAEITGLGRQHNRCERP